MAELSSYLISSIQSEKIKIVALLIMNVIDLSKEKMMTKTLMEDLFFLRMKSFFQNTLTQ